MTPSIRMTILSALTAIAAATSSPKAATAQAYPIDCAILLCLSGGWPSSTPCIRARAEFVRRITPWPVEPPLQIWRCPMRAHLKGQGVAAPFSHLRDAAYDPEHGVPQVRLIDQFINEEGRADIDIGGHEFDFVRSIRVFMVSGGQRGSGQGVDEECNRSSRVRIGRYGPQGQYGWHRGKLSDVPAAFRRPAGWGRDCPTAGFRSVFVDWRDYQGNYGWERVDY